MVAPAIVRWSLSRPRFVVFACVCYAVLAGIWASGTRLDILPPIAPARTVVRTEAPGLVAEQVDRLVTRPIESALMGAPGVAAVRAESVQGLSAITVDMLAGADPTAVQQELAGRLPLAAASLPPGVGQPQMEPLTTAAGEILKVGFTSARLGPMELRSLVQWTVRPYLLSVPGVARVAVYGGQVRRIEVRARPGDLSDSDLGLLDVVRAVRRSTSVTGAGFIDTDAQRVLVEPHGQASTPDDIAAGQIQAPGNAPVRIGDVSDVVEAPAPAFGDALIDGRPAVLAAIAAQHGVNTLEETLAVERALQALKPALQAQGVELVAGLYRPATVITDAVRDIETDLLIGAALVFVLLLAFLRDPRAALVSFVAIPISLIAAVAVMRAFGMTLNTMTLGGLVLALGVIIDDAVIDVERIVERLRDAEARRASHAQAVLQASLEVRAPVLYATLVIAIALLPMVFAPGLAGALLRPLALATILACLASMLAALLVTPALALLLLGHIRPDAQPHWSRHARAAYAASLHNRSDRPLASLLIAATALLTAAVLAFLLRPGGLPQLHGGQVEVDLAAPASISLQAMRDYGRRIGAELAALPGVAAVSEQIGRDETDATAAGIEQGRIDIALRSDAGTDVRRVAARASQALAGYPGLQASVRTGLVSLAPSDGSSFAVAVAGDDLDAVDAAAGRVARVLRSIPGAGQVTAPEPDLAASVRFDLDFPRLAIYGLSASDVLDTAQAAFEGVRAAQIYEQGRTVDIAVTTPSELREDPEAVGDLLLRSPAGVSAPLKQVARVYLSQTRMSVTREAGQVREVVSASPRPGDLDRFGRLARDAIARRAAPAPGVYLAYPDGRGGAAAVGRTLLLGALFASLGVVSVLALTLGNGRSVALILVSTLFALAGGVFALVLSGGVLDDGAIAGLVVLLGLSARSTIQLLARIDELVGDGTMGWSLGTVVHAAQERLAPILVTTLLVTLAILPLLLRGDAPGGEILHPIAVVVTGGLIGGAAFGVLILPLLVHRFWRPTARAEPIPG
jgi:CzcA family heavy metal efflux pump